MDDVADGIRNMTIRAIEADGFAEYFDSISGQGCGGLAFSWTAAAYLVLTEKNTGSRTP